MVVRPAQLGTARHLRDDHANALVARAPYHAVAGNQRWQVGAQVAAEHLARGFAVLGFHFYLHTEVRNHQAQLFRPQVATLQFLQHVLFAFGRTRGALVLDFFDAPVLAAIELAFGHEDSVRGGRLKTAGSLARQAPDHLAYLRAVNGRALATTLL
ncbi:hypothetical protein D3C80_1007790 [compost metagenome]